MKTKFNWRVFFTVLLVIACIFCEIYGVFTTLATESWTPMWWLTPGAILIAVCFAIETSETEVESLEQMADARRDEELDWLHAMVVDHEGQIDAMFINQIGLDKRIKELEDDHDCAE